MTSRGGAATAPPSRAVRHCAAASASSTRDKMAMSAPTSARGAQTRRDMLSHLCSCSSGITWAAPHRGDRRARPPRLAPLAPPRVRAFGRRRFRGHCLTCRRFLEIECGADQLLRHREQLLGQRHQLFRRQAIGLVASLPLFVGAKKSLPITDFKSFIANVKEHQKAMNYGSAGIGSSGHMVCHFMNQLIGVEVQHIPYRASGQALTALLAGDVEYVYDAPGRSPSRSRAVTYVASARPRTGQAPLLRRKLRQELLDLRSHKYIFGACLIRGSSGEVAEVARNLNVSRVLDTAVEFAC